MKVMVTGGSGFTGGHLVATLLEKGHEVHSVDRPGRRRTEGAISHAGDVLDRPSLERAMQGVDVVYHLAAAYRENLPLSILESVNIEGTRNVMETALRLGIKRVVHCSTVGVHGHIDNPPANEDAPFKPYDPYQITKTAGEKVARDYMERGLPVTIFRPVGIYGPGDTRFLKLFKSVKKGLFIMFGDGTPLYHNTYIDDVVRGIIACGEHPKAVGRTYIVCGPHAVTLNELVEKVAAAVGSAKPRIRLPFGLLWAASVVCETLCQPLKLKPPLFRRRAEWFRKHRSFDGSRLKNELGVAPQVSLEEGLRRTAEWYRAQGLIGLFMGFLVA